MSAVPDPSSSSGPTPGPESSGTPDRPLPTGAPSRTGQYLCIAALVLLGGALFATAAIVQVRRPKDAPPARVLGVPAWQIATAGFVSTLAGGLWLRRLV